MSSTQFYHSERNVYPSSDTALVLLLLKPCRPPNHLPAGLARCRLKPTYRLITQPDLSGVLRHACPDLHSAARFVWYDLILYKTAGWPVAKQKISEQPATEWPSQNPPEYREARGGEDFVTHFNKQPKTNSSARAVWLPAQLESCSLELAPPSQQDQKLSAPTVHTH